MADFNRSVGRIRSIECISVAISQLEGSEVYVALMRNVVPVALATGTLNTSMVGNPCGDRL
jgi:hypothetical protein